MGGLVAVGAAVLEGVGDGGAGPGVGGGIVGGIVGVIVGAAVGGVLLWRSSSAIRLKAVKRQRNIIKVIWIGMPSP